MRFVVISTVLFFSGSAFAQDPPNIAKERPVQAKSMGLGGCKPLGTVEGRKLWAGDCVANRQRSAAYARAPRQNQAPASKPIETARPPVEEKRPWWNRKSRSNTPARPYNLPNKSPATMAIARSPPWVRLIARLSMMLLQ